MATKAAKQQGAALLNEAKQGAQAKGLELANQAKQQGASALSNLGPSSVTGILQSQLSKSALPVGTSNVESTGNSGPTSEPSVGNTMNESLDSIKINEEKEQEKIERIEAFKIAFGQMLTDDTSDERGALAVFIKEQIKEYEQILLPAIGNSMPMEPNAKRYFLKQLYGTMKGDQPTGDPQTDVPSTENKPTVGGSGKTKSKKKRTKKPKRTRRRR